MSAAASAGTPQRWVYGPLPDLALGCGLWYAVALAVFTFAGEPIRASGAALWLPFAMLVFGTPHYGATLLRVYARREDRRGYALFAVHATIALWLVFAFGVHSAWVGSWIVTVYVTWSPWHYTGQNYGLAVMFLRRRGVPLDGGAKRWLYASFLLSYALTFLALHSGAEAGLYAPVAEDPVNYRFISLGLPVGVSSIALVAVASGYAISLAVTAALLLRRASLRDLAPSIALVATQALWFSLPLLARGFALEASIEPWASSHGTYYFLWIAIGHSVQYLWITSYYARAENDWSGQLRYHAKALLAGAAIWTVPTLLFAPGVLGRLPYDGGFAVLAAATVNLHHFVLDGAIWKLRGRVARILLRARTLPEPSGAAQPARRAWLAPAIWATGFACVVIMFASKWDQDVVVPSAAAAGDVGRVQSASARLAWVGRDSAKIHRTIAETLKRRNDVEGAVSAYERANQIRPTVDTWFKIGQLRAGQKDWAAAANAYERALEINPFEETVLFELGLARLEGREFGEARAAFERAHAVSPDHSIHRTMADRAAEAARQDADPPEAGSAAAPTDS